MLCLRPHHDLEQSVFSPKFRPDFARIGILPTGHTQKQECMQTTAGPEGPHGATQARSCDNLIYFQLENFVRWVAQ